jgi:succinate-acetate transporter protein
MSVSSSSHQLHGVAISRKDSVCLTMKTMNHKANIQQANPTLLGLIGFLIPYTSTILILCGFQGAVAPASLVGLSGDYYFFGAIAMNIAGIAEFILGNSRQ